MALGRAHPVPVDGRRPAASASARNTLIDRTRVRRRAPRTRHALVVRPRRDPVPNAKLGPGDRVLCVTLTVALFLLADPESPQVFAERVPDERGPIHFQSPDSPIRRLDPEWREPPLYDLDSLSLRHALTSESGCGPRTLGAPNQGSVGIEMRPQLALWDEAERLEKNRVEGPDSHAGSGPRIRSGGRCGRAPRPTGAGA